MALTPVTLLAPQDKVRTSSAKKGGGTFGSVAGAIAGGAIGSAGGPAGTLAGAAAGASLGGMIGEGLSPSKAASTAVERRLQSPGPQMIQSDNTSKLKQSIVALQQTPPEVRAEYSKPLVTAYMASVAQDHA
jgi:phage tail tape-measure protein